MENLGSTPVAVAASCPAHHTLPVCVARGIYSASVVSGNFANLVM